MKSLSVGIFTDTGLAAELAKKGTASDITLFNRKTGECIYTFLVPHSYPEKFSALLQVAQVIDCAVIVIEEITKELGETLLVLDALDIKNGLIVIKNPLDEEQLDTIFSQTKLKYKKTSQEEIMGALGNFTASSPEKPTKIIIDHTFQVKSVGTVALGFLVSGTIKPYDKLKAMPAQKEVMIKSIQMQSKTVDGATASSRVGLCLKGLDVSDLERGTVLTNNGVKSARKFEIKYRKCPFYKNEIKEGMKLHLSLGMQFRELTIKEITTDVMTVESVKPFAIDEGERIILADNSSVGLRLAAMGDIL